MLLLLLISIIGSVLSNKVQQVHLSYNGDMTTMTVTWLTQHNLSPYEPYVNYGKSKDKLKLKVSATTTKWLDEGDSLTTRYTHRATMTGLEPATKYYYSVGSDDSMSDVFHFNTFYANQSVRAAVYGDFGMKKSVSLDTLIKDTDNNLFDIIFHIGDIAYDLDKKNGDTGDDFMNAIEPIAAYVPYMVIAGNHEVGQNFNHLRNRFTMPNNGINDGNQFWSIDIGNTHFIGISTEYYAFQMEKDTQQQYEWLQQDLKMNKGKWTVLFMHRPMYCSNGSPDGCQAFENNITRSGATGYPALEPLFNQGGIDMVFWGHEHTYERLWPVYEGKPILQMNPQYYHNSPTPVYTLTGSAGCHDHTDPKDTIPQPFTATRIGDYGYSLLNILNDKTARTYFKSADSGKLLDEFYLTKDEGFRTGMMAH